MSDYIDKVRFMADDTLVKSVPIQDTVGRNLISTAQDTANAANTNAGKAQTAANNAQKAADDAQATADTALARGGTPGILVIGDSNLMGWGGVNVWASTVKAGYPGYFDYDFDGGAGFGTTEHTFQSVLTRKVGSMTAAEKEGVDIVAVFGGVNDRSSSTTNIVNGMQSFAEIVKTNFPNAVIRIFGMFTHNDIITDFNQTYSRLNIYRSCCRYGSLSKTRAPMTYITNSEYVTHRYDIFQDGVHLNQTGQDRVREKALNGILTGSVDVSYKEVTTISGEMTMSVTMTNNVTSIVVSGKASLTVPTGKNLRMVEVNNLPKKLICPTALDTAFACGYENETYLGIMPFAGDFQIYSPNASTMAAVIRLYANSTDLMNWAVDNVTARGCNVSICTDLL